MAIDKRIDVPFLTKFNRNEVFFDNKNALFESIIQEIGNILSTKLKTDSIDYDSPFSYGVRDLQSLDTSELEIENFKTHCREAILKFEPRLSDVMIQSCTVNHSRQTIELELVCKLRQGLEVFSTKFQLGI